MKPANYIIWILDGDDCHTALIESFENTLRIAGHFDCKLSDFASLKKMTSIIEENLGISHAYSDGVCIASAGEYNGYELILEDSDSLQPVFPLNFQQLASEENWSNIFIVNNYTPLICRTFIDDDHGIKTISAGQPNELGRRVALGIDSGLGLRDSVLLPDGQIWIGTNEAGKIGLSYPPLYQVCESFQHHELINFLQNHKEAGKKIITFETILSKKGLTLLHQFAEKLPDSLSIEATFAVLSKDPVSPTLQIFARYLGLFINIIELSFMPSGGIWVDGKIVELFGLFESPLLNFVQRGRDLSPAYKNIRELFPLKVLYGTDHAFLGAGFYINHLLQHHIWH